MATRHVSALLALGLTVSAAATFSFTARAEDAPSEEKIVPQVDNSKHRFVGVINDNAAYVRSGPSNNFYATSKLQKGDQVTVLGIKYDWLKIVPPEGSFSYVPRLYVNRTGDGNRGRVVQTTNVRAGSTMNGVKTAVQAKLEPDAEVKIIGEQDEYFKIVPPEGAYLYVNQQYVDPVRALDKAAIAGARPASERTSAEGQVVEPDDSSDVAPLAQKPTDEQSAGGTPETKPADTGAVATIEDPAPTTTPSGAAAAPKAVAQVEDFAKVEADFKSAIDLPIADQPIEKLTERYQTLAKNGKLTSAAQRIVDTRLKFLAYAGAAREEMLAFQKKKEESKAKLTALEAERQEIDARRAQTQVELYTAVGALRVSSIQQGVGGTLYRLTDPSTGRTLVYVRSQDPKFAQSLNQFVGIRGQVRTDAALKAKIITPETVEQVEQAKVNSTIIATITPPSMLRESATVEVNQGAATE
jgi:uncharacterized protein YgiM (DUF1202 family)